MYGVSLDNQFNQLYVVDLAFNVFWMIVAVLEEALTHLRIFGLCRFLRNLVLELFLDGFKQDVAGFDFFVGLPHLAEPILAVHLFWHGNNYRLLINLKNVRRLPTQAKCREDRSPVR